MIKAIFFDIGGVLAIENRSKQYDDLSNIMNFNLNEFQNIRNDKVKLFSEGKISERMYLNIFAKHFNLDINKLRYEWVRLAKKNYRINKKVENTIKKLGKNYILGTLTNIIPLHHNVRKLDDPYKYFKINLLSFEQGLSKPDINFYKLITKISKLKPEEIIFVDDYEYYLEPAKKLGMKTILFTDNKDLVNSLRKLGVKI